MELYINFKNILSHSTKFLILQFYFFSLHEMVKKNTKYNQTVPNSEYRSLVISSSSFLLGVPNTYFVLKKNNCSYNSIVPSSETV